MKHLLNQTATHEVDFMSGKVMIKELSIADIESLQVGLKSEDEVDSLATVIKVVQMAVVDANELSEEELKSFPLKALTKLSEDIMIINGLGAVAEGN